MKGKVYGRRKFRPWLFLAVLSAPAAGWAGPVLLESFRYAGPAEAGQAWTPKESSPPVVSQADGLRFPCPFQSGKDRMYWDRAVSLDLERYTGLELELTCDQPEALRSLSIYFKSGPGWYLWSKPLKRAGRQTLALLKDEAATEGKPAGWHRIEGIRISPWRGTPVAASLTLHALSAREDTLLLVRATTSGRNATEEAVEETASLLANINTSIRSINAEVESLSRSTEEASSSILEMQSSIDEVARSAASLNESVDASTSSIHEISASIRQVAESADSVQGMAEESAAAMVQMDRAIQEVGDHVREASVLTEQVSQGAEAGSQAVASTIDGIQEIRAQTSQAKAVLERLAERIGEIGEIVNVIGSINDETNLLSLNAAIIAAQAGEQGKAFAVVANHVKILAQRTAGSTKEIEALIGAVQEESSNAVRAMAAGMEAVEAGVQRSRRAGEELDKIRASSRDASSRVSEIARAAGEQARNSKHVAEAAQNTSSMVQQISSAMSEQSRASDAMLKINTGVRIRSDTAIAG